MSDLQDLANKIGEFCEARYNRSFWASTALKILIVTGSVVAGLAHFLSPSDPFNGWAMAGIVASIIVGLLGALLLLFEHNSAGEINVARQALDQARQREGELTIRDNRQSEHQNFIQGVLRRMTELYSAMTRMCSVIQATISTKQAQEVKIIESLLESSERSLKIAAGFQIEQHWTICVYRAEHDETDGRTYLRYKAGLRSVPCDLSKARAWPEGVGAGGGGLRVGDRSCRTRSLVGKQ